MKYFANEDQFPKYERALARRQMILPSPKLRRLVKVKNVTLRGSGASVVPQDRGASQTAAQFTSNPLDYVSYFERWREFVRWYRKAWPVRKIVDIPVDDSFRKDFQLKGIDEADSKILMADWERLEGNRQNSRAWKQERLLGGCALYMGLADAPVHAVGAERVGVGDEVRLANLDGSQQGGFKFLNLVDVNRIHRGDIGLDVFQEEYDRLKGYLVDGTFTDMSRLVVYDSEPMFNRQNLTLLQNWVVNPAGFGDSIIGPLYDLLVRVEGTQEAAYQLINMASILLASVRDYKALSTTQKGEEALAKLDQVMSTASIYRAVIMDGMDAKWEQHAATFGSVPELLMSFFQILCGAADIPATRFLGQNGQGMSDSQKGDLQNYYNSIDALQVKKLKPRMLKQFGYIGVCRFGVERWLQMKAAGFDIFFPPLWNMDEKEEAELAKTWIEALKTLWDAGMIGDIKQVQNELKARDIFLTDLQLEEALEEEPELPVDPGSELGKLAAAEKPDTSKRPTKGVTTVENTGIPAEDDAVKVRLVDGDAVKREHDMDFVEGGHGYVYDFIPKDEIWIDEHLDESQRGFVERHERRERALMMKGMGYEEAHAQVNEVERQERESQVGNVKDDAGHDHAPAGSSKGGQFVGQGGGGGPSATEGKRAVDGAIPEVYALPLPPKDAPEELKKLYRERQRLYGQMKKAQGADKKALGEMVADLKFQIDKARKDHPEWFARGPGERKPPADSPPASPPGAKAGSTAADAVKRHTDQFGGTMTFKHHSGKTINPDDNPTWFESAHQIEMADRAATCISGIHSMPRKMNANIRKAIKERPCNLQMWDRGQLDYHDKNGTLKHDAVGYYQGRHRALALSTYGMDARPSMHPRYGDWTVDKTFEGTARHEYGHYVFDAGGYQLQSKWYDALNETHLHLSDSEFKRVSSRYSNTDSHEAFAEAFCAYTHKGYTRGGLPRRMEEFMDDLFSG